MRTAHDILALFESRMEELGMTQSQLEDKAFGKPGNTAIQSLKKGAGPSFERVADMARALGLELYLGRPRRHGLVEPEAASDFHVRNTGKAGYLPIPWTESKPGKGSSPLALLDSWLEDHALIIDELSAVLPDITMVEGVDPARTVAILEAHAPRRGAGQLWCLKQGAKVLLARIAWVQDGFVIMPPRLDQAPQFIRADTPDAPRPLGRVACLATLPAA
jgi:hypothetical protein